MHAAWCVWWVAAVIVASPLPRHQKLRTSCPWRALERVRQWVTRSARRTCARRPTPSAWGRSFATRRRRWLKHERLSRRALRGVGLGGRLSWRAQHRLRQAARRAARLLRQPRLGATPHRQSRTRGGPDDGDVDSARAVVVLVTLSAAAPFGVNMSSVLRPLSLSITATTSERSRPLGLSPRKSCPHQELPRSLAPAGATSARDGGAARSEPMAEAIGDEIHRNNGENQRVGSHARGHGVVVASLRSRCCVAGRAVVR